MGDDEDLFGEDEDLFGDAAAPAVPARQVEFLVEPLDHDLDYSCLKLPNVIGVEYAPFDREKFQMESLIPFEEVPNFEGDKEIKIRAPESAIRWRYKRNKDGALEMDGDEYKRESNARMVEWEDGSTTLQVGAEHFHVSAARDQPAYLFEDMMEGKLFQTFLKTTVACRPFNVKAKAHERLKSAQMNKTKPQVRTILTSTTEAEGITRLREGPPEEKKDDKKGGRGGGGGKAKDKGKISQNAIRDEDRGKDIVPHEIVEEELLEERSAKKPRLQTDGAALGSDTE